MSPDTAAISPPAHMIYPVACRTSQFLACAPLDSVLGRVLF